MSIGVGDVVRGRRRSGAGVGIRFGGARLRTGIGSKRWIRLTGFVHFIVRNQRYPRSCYQDDLTSTASRRRERCVGIHSGDVP